jgi:CHAD domain-containing protein
MGAHTAELTDAPPAKDKLPQLARKRLVRFVTLYPKALVGDAPETIHDLRVASRRLQQVLRLLAPNGKSSGDKKLLRKLRKVRRAFGACRNLDVCISVLDGKRETTTTASLRQAWEALKLWLEEKRAGQMERGRAELRQHDLLDFIDRIQARIENITAEPESITQLWERARAALAEWRNKLDAAREEAQIETIHAFRIAGKRLRYCVESLVELGHLSFKPMVANLKALQDDLGAWHDHVVLRELIAEFIGRPGFLAAEPGMCRNLLLEMEREKQRDHAMINEAIAKAEKLAEGWTEMSFDEPAAEAPQKDQ